MLQDRRLAAYCRDISRVQQHIETEAQGLSLRNHELLEVQSLL